MVEGQQAWALERFLSSTSMEANMPFCIGLEFPQPTENTHSHARYFLAGFSLA
jgi:hypothetical protein